MKQTQRDRLLREGDSAKKKILASLERHTSVVGDCWVWTGYIGRPDGYGRLTIAGTGFLTHRLSYTFRVGPIPVGLTLDHLCRNRACLRPDHLEPVTLTENTLRGVGPTAERARKTVCVRGHDLMDAKNVYVEKRGYRHCRTCHRENVLARHRRLYRVDEAYTTRYREQQRLSASRRRAAAR